MKISNHFDLREFVTPEAYTALGDKSLWLIDIRIVNIAEAIREGLGKPVIINNWHTGGHYQESGLRNFNTGTGAKYSQHKYGRAIDMKIQDTEPETVRQYIRDNFLWLNGLGLTTIELETPSWIHVDCRNTGLSTLFEVPFQ
jgi:hypothetical protein